MFTWIISTAQQARPKVIHHKEPVRAQVNRSSVVVTRKPFSSSCFAHLEEPGFLDAAWNQSGGAGNLLLADVGIAPRAKRHSHSSAPFFQA
jgi:hypothetical protein